MRLAQINCYSKQDRKHNANGSPRANNAALYASAGLLRHR